MMLNGVDYTLPFVAVVSFCIFFAVQLMLCRYARSGFLRSLPWVWVIAVLGLAVACLFTEPNGSFLDLRNAFALLLSGYAAICAAGIVLAHLLHRLQTR